MTPDEEIGYDGQGRPVLRATIRKRRTRAEHRARGLCYCGHQKRPGRTLCDGCTERSRACNAKRRGRV